MTVTVRSGEVEPALQAELEAFERTFTYPLDDQRTFRISHHPDYLRFFSRTGTANCFISRNGQGVDGVLTTVERRLILPGSDEPQSALYLCDLKTAPGAARGRVFLGLAAEARRHVPSRLRAAFGIVMRGTKTTPDLYSGGLGIPKFEALAEVAILRVPAREGSQSGVRLASPQAAHAASCRLRGDGAVLAPEVPKSGSRFEPLGLIDASGEASAVLEDTLDSKRLFCDRGEELLSGHLSYLAYRCPLAASKVVEAALTLCWERGIPALFFSVPNQRVSDWDARFLAPETTRTGATIYGVGLPKNLAWNINTSEV